MAYRNLRYRVEIDGITQASFREAIVPESKADVIEYREGEETNPATVRRLLGNTEYGNLILKWGITSSMELYGWHSDVLAGTIQRKSMSVILMDEQGTDRSRWNFTQAWPSRYDAPEFDAQGNDVAIETLEIVFEGMERVS